MRRRLESLLPILVLMGFLLATAGVNQLLTNAKARGVDALEMSVTAEVEAIARSQNQRLTNTFSGTAGLSGTDPADPYRMTEGSPEDLAKLEEIVEILPPTFRSGFYLVDLEGRVTQGVRFLGDSIGERFEWPGYEELVASPAFLQGGGLLPVSEGLTTREPVLGLAIPIFDIAATPPTLKGTFLFESVVAVDSDFNKEIGALKRGETGRFYFLDSRGSVVASNEASAIAQRIGDERFLTNPPGLERLDGEVVVLADVPIAGWRVAFRQDVDEFERSLAGPLDSVTRILVLALLTSGFILTTLLFRRLKAARIEQERLRVLTESQQEFISIVSHELRTPVAGVLGFLETSLDHWDVMGDDDRKTAVARAASNARRLQAMTRDVLDTQSIEGGRLIGETERLDLAAEVRVAVEGAFELDSDRQVKLDLPREPVWIVGDADRLQQVLANLIDNARKNSPAVEPISISVRTEGASAEVAVTDRGPGIPEDALEQIFDKFVRGRGNTVTGTGLGLYISRQIVNAHDGRLWAESTPGHGATFRFVLPTENGGG
ncbi:MAG: sensor histidine kinase [Microthrixaceae bacterium]